MLVLVPHLVVDCQSTQRVLVTNGIINYIIVLVKYIANRRSRRLKVDRDIIVLIAVELDGVLNCRALLLPFSRFFELKLTLILFFISLLV